MGQELLLLNYAFGQYERPEMTEISMWLSLRPFWGARGHACFYQEYKQRKGEVSAQFFLLTKRKR